MAHDSMSVGLLGFLGALLGYLAGCVMATFSSYRKGLTADRGHR